MGEGKRESRVQMRYTFTAVETQADNTANERARGKHDLGRLCFPILTDKRIKPRQGSTIWQVKREGKRKGKIRPRKILCLSLKQAFEMFGSPFHLRLRLFLDDCCMDLGESRAQSLESISPDRNRHHDGYFVWLPPKLGLDVLVG